MKLDEATAVLRPRSAWEAVDLGCALARRHWGKLMRGWLTVALPLWALIALVFHDSPVWACFFIWLTKPVLTRQPIYFLSRALFGTPPRARDFWRDWRSSLGRGLLPGLTYKRLAFQRSFRLPVMILEGQSGRSCTQRVNVLSAHGGSNAAWLSFTAVKLEIVIACGLMLWMNSFLREGLEDWIGTSFGDAGVFTAIPEWYLWAGNGIYAMAIALIEPMYAAAGFALYINSRTHLEGWDIEVTFRRMSGRLTASAATALCVLFAGFFCAENVRAAPAEADAKEKVPVFKPEFDRGSGDRESSSGSGGFGSGGAAGMNWIGFVIIGAVIFIVAFLIWKSRVMLRRSGSGGKETTDGPKVVMGMNLAPESLPEDIPQTAWREYQAGRAAEALRLLYRGALAWLVNRAALPVHESDTEGDCLRHAQQLDDAARVSFFESLTAAWVNCAYADLAPAATPMKQLCDHWPFSMRQRPSVGAGPAVAAWFVLPLAALLLQGCGVKGGKVEYEEKILGYKGAARVNPWLAAQEMLRRMGTPTETRATLANMPGTYTALVVPTDAITSRGASQQMLDWAMRGGHLIVACSATDRFHNDWTDGDPRGPEDYEPILEALEVRVSKGAPKNLTVDFGDGRELRFDRDIEAGLDVRMLNHDVLAGSGDSAILVSAPHYSGRITLLASAMPFRNRWIGDADHAAIFYEITRLQPANTVLFISKSRMNLWQMLMEHAWMPLVATVLLIVLWLWRNLPRFGPAVPSDTSIVRHFGTQLDEAGTFLSDRAGQAALLGAARRSVLHAAAQRGLHPDAPDFIEHLSARSSLPAAAIQSALHDDSSTSDVISAAATLQKLQQSVGATL
jgi:hypothetical protein